MSTARPLRAGLYARVSTTDQTCENQLLELRRYCEARGWTACEYTDAAVSGAKTSRPALDQLLADATKRKIDVVVCWRLDRFGRNLRHLVVTIEDLAAINVGFISLGESIDTTSPTGGLLLGVLGSFAQFERERIRERVVLGIDRARRQGKRLGRQPYAITDAQFEAVADRSLRDAATALGVSRSVVHRWRLSRKPLKTGLAMTAICSTIPVVAA
jgi:DNA invertase Pin-like site-specific DNA recombinase